MDNLTKAQRSYCMSRVRSANTDLEAVVRSGLHQRGLRFRKHLRSLPGSPDIVFGPAKVVVFVDGDFWHGYRFPRWRHTLSPFWQDKIDVNRSRDKRNFARLRRQGWLVIRIWQHDVKRNLVQRLDDVERVVRRRRRR
ncbi:MAG: very short patch repair endonuclease [Labilithrix sp.]|nr:very short patch repair endonuclease [Labilithrix sp.]